jgi:hypothetical protein
MMYQRTDPVGPSYVLSKRSLQRLPVNVTARALIPQVQETTRPPLMTDEQAPLHVNSNKATHMCALQFLQLDMLYHIKTDPRSENELDMSMTCC